MSFDTALPQHGNLGQPVISAQGVGKTYRLYRSPMDRLWQMLWPHGQPRFQDFKALQDVSFELRRGEVMGIVGVNGAGKSTLLQLLAGLRAAEAGELRLQGRPLAAWPPRERATRLAWLAQQGEAEAELPARSLVELGRLPRHGLLGAPDATDATAVAQAMADHVSGAAGIAVASGAMATRALATSADIEAAEFQALWGKAKQLALNKIKIKRTMTLAVGSKLTSNIWPATHWKDVESIRRESGKPQTIF
jgi:energy-coupling factor transporter ATP-binding protein EcfA2